MIKNIFATWIVVIGLGEFLLFAFFVVFVQPGVGESRLQLSAGALVYFNAVFAPVIVVLTFLLSIVSVIFVSRSRK